MCVCVCVSGNKALLVLQVSALVTMYSHEEDLDGAIDVFKQAIEHYRSQQVCPRGLVSTFAVLTAESEENSGSVFTVAGNGQPTRPD